MARILTLALLAVLGFWMLGAYNRLVRLRTVTRNAFAPLASQLRQRHAVALTLAEASRALMGAHGDPDSLARAVLTTAAARRASTASDAVQSKPLQGSVLQQAVVAEAELVSALDELTLALQDLTSGDGPDPAVSELLRQRDALQEQIKFSLQVYQAAADDYNAALALFPTTVAAAIFRFHAAPLFPVGPNGAASLPPNGPG